MKNLRYLTTLAFLLVGLFTLTAQADQFVREHEAFPVTVDGSPLAIPFFGGLNDPKPSFVDLNNDGLVDLCIGFRNGTLIYLRNIGAVNNPHWLTADNRIGNIDIGTWHTFIDIDADGDKDLFCDNRNAGTTFCENIGTPSVYDFVVTDTLFGPGDSTFLTEINNTPKFADLDGDGDFDFFYGNPTGYMWYYQNIGTPQNPQFEFITPFYDSVFAYPGAGGGVLAQLEMNPQHGFSNVCFADIDDDNDLDLFWGDLFNTNMYLFRNLGTPLVSNLQWETETYLPTTSSGYNHAAFWDLDNDNDLDLLVGAANYADIDNFILYTNTGNIDSAAFVETSRNYISMIDVGSGSHPTFGDIDDDGDIDMLLGGLNGLIALYENTGSASNPAFTMVDSQFQSIDVLANANPCLADLDSDGDLDLLIGTSIGRIQYWRNDGTPQNFNAVLETDFYQGIKTDRQAVPRIADMNNDNLLDLVVGEWDFNSKANVRLYQNTGTPTVPAFTLFSAFVLPVATREFTIPCLYDWDKDNRVDVLLGVYNRGLTWFRNTAPIGQFPDSFTFVAMPDTIPGWTEGYSLSASFTNIDNDGDNDLFIGEDDGGVSFFRNAGCCIDNTGDVNGSGTDNATIQDLTYLINYLFRDGPAPICPQEANVNGTGALANIGDLTYLVNFLFRSGAAPVPCP